MAASGERVDLARALRDAGKTALITFGVFLPLVGIYTLNDINNVLTFETRFPLLLTLVAIVAGSRLLFTVVIEPWASRRRALATRRPLALPRSFTRWFIPFAIGFVLVYPIISILGAGWGGSIKWIDNFGIQILIYIMLGWGLNIVVGLAGLLDLGYVAFYAVGSYSYALLALNFGLSFWILLPLAGILSAFWGVLLGFPVLRLRGDYLAIVTLAFGEIIRII